MVIVLIRVGVMAINKLLNGVQAMHAHCLACGPQHLVPSLGLTFKWQSEEQLQSQFELTEDYQGYSGIMHGGVASTLLDSIMTTHLMQREIYALTIELSVHFKQSISIGQTVMLYAQEEKVRHRVHWMSAWLEDSHQRCCIDAHAKFLEKQ